MKNSGLQIFTPFLEGLGRQPFLSFAQDKTDVPARWLGRFYSSGQGNLFTPANALQHEPRSGRIVGVLLSPASHLIATAQEL